MASGTIVYVKAGNETHAVASSAYGVCSTAANTAAKTVNLTCDKTDGGSTYYAFTLLKGATIHVKFTNSNTATTGLTLNVNSTGAKPLVKYGTTIAGSTAATSWTAGSVLTLTYDGASWIMNDHIDDTNTTYVFNTAYNASSNKVATMADVTNAISGISGPMVFKGTLGTGGSATSIDAAAAANTGHTYKVITANTYQGVTAEVGDMLVSTGSAWVLIPAGDETVTQSATTGISIAAHGTTSIGSASNWSAGSFTRGSFSGGSGSFTQGSFSGGSGSFSATVTNNVLSFSHTHTAATHGTDSHTHNAATHAADSFTAPKLTITSTTVTTGTSHTVTDSGHTHNI